eukprot:NODE_1488_length_1513_cov_29.627049_g1344_i0.p2 GENE.NODE_1488_length_1513_cov_29.627049_g1344_i0~~NODE_1488_length_1513_cov_29.627049_g1344_i0.p2  ORF type:complete len:173 (-),score=37.01 NODE_1488_length_1513_cov_29.627049_g1344_i0:389-907(-)
MAEPAQPRTALSNAGKGAVFWGSLTKTAMRGYIGKNLGLCSTKTWNFLNDSLILGGLPVKTKVGASGDHLSKLRRQLAEQDKQLGLVVSCTEPEESRGYGLSIVEFVQEEDWRRELGVEEFVKLSIPDFSAEVSMEQLVSVTDLMSTVIHERRSMCTARLAKAAAGSSLSAT